jgi:hypothetical protein
MPWYWQEMRPTGAVRCKGDDAPSAEKAEGGRKAILEMFWLDEDMGLDEAFGMTAKPEGSNRHEGEKRVPWHDGFTSGGE